jgi:SAM-dependent methyltransferase
MPKSISQKEIREHWIAAAAMDRDADGLRPVARDPFLQQAIEDAIESRLPPDSLVADIGCGDGESTIRFARCVKAIVGIDYVSQFVDKASRSAAQSGVDNARFIEGDVLNLQDIRAKVGLVDVAITIRCLINLDSWSKQRQAIHQISTLVRPGGMYLLSEGWSDAMEGLNKLRARGDIPPIETVPYNRLIDRKQLESEIKGVFEVEEYCNLGFYIAMSRFLQPSWVHPSPPRHDHPINALAADLQRNCVKSPLFHDVDYAGIYLLRRVG